MTTIAVRVWWGLINFSTNRMPIFAFPKSSNQIRKLFICNSCVAICIVLSNEILPALYNIILVKFAFCFDNKFSNIFFVVFAQSKESTRASDACTKFEPLIRKWKHWENSFLEFSKISFAH